MRAPVPPFDEHSARRKVQAAEDAWNTRDPQRVASAYTLDSVWRNRSAFLTGRQEIEAFLTDKWAKELDYALRKQLWAFTDVPISEGERRIHGPRSDAERERDLPLH